MMTIEVSMTDYIIRMISGFCFILAIVFWIIDTYRWDKWERQQEDEWLETNETKAKQI